MARKLLARILEPLAVVVAISAVLFGAFAINVMDSLYGESTASDLESSARALASALPDGAFAAPPPGGPARATGLDPWIRRVSQESGWRLSIIRADGAVIADSAAIAAGMENHASRPEIAAALAGRSATARRRSATTDRELFYAAAPAMRDGRILGVVRIAADIPTIEARLRPHQAGLLAAVLLSALAALLAAAFFSRRIALPLRLLAEASRAVAMGDRTRPIPQDDGPEEVIVLARGLASMAEELDRRVREAEAEGRERAAILDGMSEAVLALDRDCRVRMANSSAASLFGLSAKKAQGLALLELTRSTELQSAAEACIAGGESLETQLALYGEGERWFQAFVAPLKGSGGVGATAGTDLAGAVIVLNDITRLRRLERVRKDFVANVSHELRTPIHLIKGFAEALDEGAIEDIVQARRFLGILAGNATRMESLIDDLLTLARLEQEGNDWLKCRVCGLDALLEEAVEAVLPKAEEKSIAILQSCREGLAARVNAGLFVQAVVNLLDNAVKYSPRGSKVVVSAVDSGSTGEAIVVAVADNGIGIPAKDLSRIFERFYRVDKARSKQLGGTGLGLAIVRHIALAHGGSVAVESVAGEGSCFSIKLPVAGPPGPVRDPSELGVIEAL